MSPRQKQDPPIADVVAALDALAAAARRPDRDGYLAALQRARGVDVTEAQILDAYRWGRRGMGATDLFDHRGQLAA